MLTIYIGAVFNLMGGLQSDGSPSDFTGWTILANLYNQNGSVLISPITVTWIDITQGLLSFNIADTSGFAPQKARIDLKLTTPMGETVLGPPTYLRLAQSPIA